LQRVEEFGAGVEDDLALIALWVAFNALYGRWDSVAQQPWADRDSCREFLTRITRLDQQQLLTDILQHHKPLVMKILEDQYLSNYYWQDPTPVRASKSKKSMYDACTWYLEGRWLMILERLVERIYLLRCQLVHGAATHGGTLNRDPLRRCVQMLKHLLPGFLTVITDQGADEDWGAMCYPPLRTPSRR
jgi:hypothetical protein